MCSNKVNQPEVMDKFFDIRAEGYDHHMKENVHEFDAFYNLISKSIEPSEERVKILDVGCGTGLELEGVFKKVPKAHVTGIDLSEGMLDKLLLKYTPYRWQLTLIRDSYITHPFGEGVYNYIISVMTMHHWVEEEKLRLYKKIRKALKVDGKYIEGDYVVDKEEEENCLKEYKEEMEKLDQKGLYHIDIPMTTEHQLKLFKDAGFSKVDVLFSGENNVVFVAKV